MCFPAKRPIGTCNSALPRPSFCRTIPNTCIHVSTFSPNAGATFHPLQELISRPINGVCDSPEMRQWYTHEWHMTVTLDGSVVSINQDNLHLSQDVSSKGPPPLVPLGEVPSMMSLWELSERERPQDSDLPSFLLSFPNVSA